MAADLTVNSGDTYTVTGDEVVGVLDVQGTLIVESTGSLTFTTRSEIDGTPGGHIIVNGGDVVGNARLDMDQTGTITMNGGTFRVNDEFKFPDSAPGPVYMYLNAGVLSAHDLQTILARNPHYTVGGGVLRIDGDVEGVGEDWDPREWIAQGFMVPAAGYDEVVVEYVASGDYTEVRAVSSAVNVQFASATGAGLESVSPVDIPVYLSATIGSAVSVNYAVTGGTADSVSDYTLTSGTLNFAANQSTPETITMTVVNDGIVEADETVVITLSNPVNAELGDEFEFTYTIEDFSTGISFVSNSSEAAETDFPVTIDVTRTLPLDETVTVEYGVVSGSALGNGVDYILDAGVLQFDPQVQTQSINLALIDDEIDESPDETIVIALSNPSSNTKLGSITTHTFTILPGLSGPCPKGDLDGDCQVTIVDLQILGGQWLDEQGLCSGADPDCANLDGLAGVNMNDFVTLSSNWQEVGTTVVINEVMASNATTIEDPDESGEYPDWIELYNVSPDTIDLGGMYLTDSDDTPTKWQIPGGISIASGGYVLFWADGDDEQGDYHTNFKLDAGGDNVSLYSSDGVTLINTLDFRDYSQVTDISYGPYPDGSDDLRYLSNPTPGYVNSGAYIGEVADTKFSHDRGFYDAGFNLAITCDTPGATIKYTIDGTEPSQTNGSTYSGPLFVNSTVCIRAVAYKTGWLSTNIDTQSYFFLDDVISQSDINQTVVSSHGTTAFKNALKSLPTLSIVKDPAEAIIDNPPNTYGAVSVELIYPYASYEGFQTDCQISTHSDGTTTGKQSYRLEFKNEFGPPSLNYPFFESAPVNADSATDRFDRIILRAASNEPMSYPGDPWAAQSQIAMSGYGSHSTFVHLYINGKYMGLSNPKERPDAWFTSAYFGGEFEDYFATNHGIERCSNDVSPDSLCHLSGANTRFDQMMSLAYERDLTNSSKYETFKQLCDVTNFADYTILFWLSGFGDNMDNNWYAGMRNDPLNGDVPPEGLMMFMWDAEYVFLNAGGPPGNEDPWVPSYFWSSAGKYMISDIWQALYDNAEFRMHFADRVYKHCFNGGALTDANAEGRWNAIADWIDEAMICEYALYGDADRRAPEEGSEYVDMTGHVNIFINALRSASYGHDLYPSIDPPNFQHGGQVATGYNLAMTNPNGSGTIYYALDGADPRAVGGAIAGTAYSGPITLNKSTVVKARVYNGGTWSAVHEALFSVGPVSDNLRITEIMYHPVDATQIEKDAAGDQTLIDEDFEYIELKNIGASVINLNLVQFTDGVEFTFGDYSLGAGQYAVIVKNQDAFEARNPGVAVAKIAGTYVGAMDNGGEEIVLRDALGVEIHDFDYRDSWFVVTDGGGYSLNKVDPDTASNTAPDSWDTQDGWRPSSVLNGTPGVEDTGYTLDPGDVVISEVMTHTDDLVYGDWIEIWNRTGSPVYIGGWFLSDNEADLAKYEIAAGDPRSTIAPDSYVVFDAVNDFGAQFGLSEHGEDVYLTSGSGGVLTGEYSTEQENFGAAENGVSLGMYIKTDGTDDFVRLQTVTKGAANNNDPVIGPLVISEIMYNPQDPDADSDAEFIEITNITGNTVYLYDTSNPTNTWQINGADYAFETGITVGPNETFLVTRGDPATFRSTYGIDGSIAIYGPYPGALDNGGEKVTLISPDTPDPVTFEIPEIRIDRVNYSDGSHPVGSDPWPITPDGGGQSLARKVLGDYGNDLDNWQAATPTPGTP